MKSYLHEQYKSLLNLAHLFIENRTQGLADGTIIFLQPMESAEGKEPKTISLDEGNGWYNYAPIAIHLPEKYLTVLLIDENSEEERETCTILWADIHGENILIIADLMKEFANNQQDSPIIL